MEGAAGCLSANLTPGCLCGPRPVGRTSPLSLEGGGTDSTGPPPGWKVPGTGLLIHKLQGRRQRGAWVGSEAPSLEPACQPQELTL